MIIVRTEKPEMGRVGVCEDCGNETNVRKVEVKNSAFGGAGRGFFDICFDCIGPRVFWRKGEGDQTIYESPA